MSEREDFADWKNQSNSINPWLAWQARANLAAECIAELEAKLRVAERRVEGLEYMLDQVKTDKENSDELS